MTIEDIRKADKDTLISNLGELRAELKISDEKSDIYTESTTRRYSGISQDEARDSLSSDFIDDAMIIMYHIDKIERELINRQRGCGQ